MEYDILTEKSVVMVAVLMDEVRFAQRVSLR
jgi:hypothetical protein